MAVLACAAAALDDGRDDLQMGRIEGQRQVHGAARRADVRVETLMVFDVARAAARVQVAASLEPGSSAIVIVAEPGPHGALIEELELLGGDVLTVDIGADVATQLEAHQEAAYSALISQLQDARDEEDDA